MWMQKGLPTAKSNCNINQLQRIKRHFLCLPWVAGMLTSCSLYSLDHMRFVLYCKKMKLSYFTLIFAYSLKTIRFLCSNIVATSYKYSILNVCWTPVDIVTQNQACINDERSSIMSQSRWKQPPIKTIRGQSMCFHPQDGNCTHMAQTLWRSPIHSKIINIKLAGKKSKCQSALQSLGRWELHLFLIQFHSPQIYS